MWVNKNGIAQQRKKKRKGRENKSFQWHSSENVSLNFNGKDLRDLKVDP